jgi:hypothetical protein
LLPKEAVSVQLPKTRVPADQQQTIEVPSPHDSNPLAPSERSRGKETADASDTVKRARASAAGSHRPPRLRQLLEDVPLLYAQRHTNEDKNAPGQSRIADVFYYNYATNQSMQVVVNLNNNTVQETKVASGVVNQPYSSSAEIKVLLQLIFEDPVHGPRLRRAYQDVTGQTLNDVSPLEARAQAGIFFPGSAAHTPLGDFTAACAQDRCMQLFVPNDDTHFIDMSDVVVDLSTGQVLSGGVGPAGHGN